MNSCILRGKNQIAGIPEEVFKRVLTSNEACHIPAEPSNRANAAVRVVDILRGDEGGFSRKKSITIVGYFAGLLKEPAPLHLQGKLR